MLYSEHISSNLTLAFSPIFMLAWCVRLQVPVHAPAQQKMDLPFTVEDLCKRYVEMRCPVLKRL